MRDRVASAVIAVHPRVYYNCAREERVLFLLSGFRIERDLVSRFLFIENSRYYESTGRWREKERGRECVCVCVCPAISAVVSGQESTRVRLSGAYIIINARRGATKQVSVRASRRAGS